MPRINADNVAEHVARQRAAVIDAAVRLFSTHGYTEVSLADVANEVGLARSSVYRYVPDKVHLLVEWYRDAVPRTIASWEDAVAGDDPAPERARRWADRYLAWTREPEHDLVAPLTDSLSSLDDDTRAEVAALHRSMMDVVARVVADAGVPADEVQDVVALLAGLTLGAARADAGPDADAHLRARLGAAINALLRSPTPG